MNTITTRTRLLAAALAGSATVATALALLVLRPGPAEAQGVMAVPACQCSVPTTIPGLSSTVVHCQCGGMSCVVSEHTGAGRNANLMQCVR